MTDWEKSLAHDILQTEQRTAETWQVLVKKFQTAIAEIDAILQGKSATKLVLQSTGDVINLSSNLGKKAAISIDRHNRNIQLVFPVNHPHQQSPTYIFHLTEHPTELKFTGGLTLPGHDAKSNISLEAVVEFTVKTLIDLKH